MFSSLAFGSSLRLYRRAVPSLALNAVVIPNPKDHLRVNLAFVAVVHRWSSSDS